MLWVGAKPRPAPFPYITKHKFKYICECTYNKEQVWICWLVECFKGFVLWEGPGVKPRGLQYFYKANLSHSNKRHVAPKHWATCPLFHSLPYNTCQLVTGPRASNQKCATSSLCHISMMVRPSTWPYGLYGQVQSSFFSLFDFSVKMRYLLHTDSV